MHSISRPIPFWVVQKLTTKARRTQRSRNGVVGSGVLSSLTAKLTGASWPGTTLRKINGVAVRFVAGYGAAGSSVPQMLRQVILFLVGHFYENREATSQGIYKLPFGVDDLLWNFFWSY